MRNINGGGILVYICDSITSCLMECDNYSSTFEGLVIKISFDFKKLLLMCSYNAHRKVWILSRCINKKNIVLKRDYNAEVT